jgi:hypothetical protein
VRWLEKMKKKKVRRKAIAGYGITILTKEKGLNLS